jgi:hypothetical protein
MSQRIFVLGHLDHCRWDGYATGQVGWLVTDVSGQSIGRIFKGQSVEERNNLYGYLGPLKLHRYGVPNIRTSTAQRRKDLCCTVTETLNLVKYK